MEVQVTLFCFQLVILSHQNCRLFLQAKPCPFGVQSIQRNILLITCQNVYFLVIVDFLIETYQLWPFLNVYYKNDLGPNLLAIQVKPFFQVLHCLLNVSNEFHPLHEATLCYRWPIHVRKRDESFIFGGLRFQKLVEKKELQDQIFVRLGYFCFIRIIFAQCQENESYRFIFYCYFFY